MLFIKWIVAFIASVTTLIFLYTLIVDLFTISTTLTSLREESKKKKADGLVQREKMNYNPKSWIPGLIISALWPLVILLWR